MSEEDNDIDDELAVYARCMTGGRRQLAEALRFIPVLIVGITVGLTGLIATFWTGPSATVGFISILWFVCSPVVAFCWYLRWKSRPGVADTELRIRDEGLEVVAIDERVPCMFIAWGQFISCRTRVLAGLHVSLCITAQTDAGPLHRFAAEYTLCGSFRHVSRFTLELDRRVESQRGQM